MSSTSYDIPQFQMPVALEVIRDSVGDDLALKNQSQNMAMYDAWQF
jgi:hypothetical protein